MIEGHQLSEPLGNNRNSVTSLEPHQALKPIGITHSASKRGTNREELLTSCVRGNDLMEIGRLSLLRGNAP
jgi:hypothetical protein